MASPDPDEKSVSKLPALRPCRHAKDAVWPSAPFVCAFRFRSAILPIIRHFRCVATRRSSGATAPRDWWAVARALVGSVASPLMTLSSAAARHADWRCSHKWSLVCPATRRDRSYSPSRRSTSAFSRRKTMLPRPSLARSGWPASRPSSRGGPRSILSNRSSQTVGRESRGPRESSAWGMVMQSGGSSGSRANRGPAARCNCICPSPDRASWSTPPYSKPRYDQRLAFPLRIPRSARLARPVQRLVSHASSRNGSPVTDSFRSGMDLQYCRCWNLAPALQLAARRRYGSTILRRKGGHDRPWTQWAKCA
jgi:hypothetical protein